MIGQPFWRALHQPLVRQHPGTGLRLYLAQQIFELHGSELLFSGEPSMGSTFSFTLPLGLEIRREVAGLQILSFML